MPRDRSRTAPPAKSKNNIKPDSELGKIMADIKKRGGDHTVMTGLLAAQNTFIETGIFLIDFALLGGLQESRVNQIYGWEASGKSTTAARAVAAAQRKYPTMFAAWLDAEGTLDTVWAQLHGVDLERLIIAQPEKGELAVDCLEGLIRTREVCIVVLDSIPAIVPTALIERSAEDKTMAVRASLMGVCCSKIIAGLGAERGRGHYPTVILINQWRRKVGFTMGDNRILPGGDQVRFMSSVMLEMKKKKGHVGDDTHENSSLNYNEHAFDVDKLKGAQSIQQGEFKMVIGHDYKMSDSDADMPAIPLPAGTVDDYKVVVTYAQRMGFVSGGGQSWKLDEIDGTFKKKSEIVKFLVENPDEYIILKRKLIMMKRQEAKQDPIPKDNYLLGRVK